MANFERVLSQTTPLCYLPNGKLVCYHRGCIIILCIGTTEKKISIPICSKEKFLGWNRFASRLLRFGVRAAIALDDNHVILFLGNYLYELDLQTSVLSQGWFSGNRKRPLHMTNVKGIDGFCDGVYFGEYLKNNDKDPVSIYHRVGVDQWEVVYTFSQGEINHVHNIVPDPYRHCLWIFTGDFGESAAIWKVTDDFKKVERFVFGDQKWRGCVAFATPEGLLYATDTPFAENNVYLFCENGKEKVLASLSGSCIYGCRWKDKYVFSTTVEADGRDESLIKLMFSKQRGAGIKDEYIHLYMGDNNDGFMEIYKEKKDTLPFIFQFGAFKFPTGVNNTDSLFFQPMASMKNDQQLLKLDLTSV